MSQADSLNDSVGIDIPIMRLRPLRERKVTKREDDRILASIKAVGLIEPLVVYPEGDDYVILDGAQCYRALLELGVELVPCILGRQREAFTGNRMVNRLSPVQEHRMIEKSLLEVDEASIAAALGITNLSHRLKKTLLKQLHADVAAAFDAGKISRSCAREFTHVSPSARRKSSRRWRVIRTTALLSPAPWWSRPSASAGEPRPQAQSMGQNSTAEKRPAEEAGRGRAEARFLFATLQAVHRRFVAAGHLRAVDADQPAAAGISQPEPPRHRRAARSHHHGRTGLIMRTHWTRESIIRHLLEREAKATAVGWRTRRWPFALRCRTADLRLLANAIQAAGIAPQQVLTWERWSPARILVMIRHLARRRRPLTTDQLERRYHNVVTAARRHFGSWSKAVLAAGVKPTKLQRVVPWNQERVIEAILRRALRNESLVARLVEPRSLLDAAQRFFGSWAAAVAAAGLDSGLTVPPPGGKRRRPAKAHLLHRKEDEIGRVPWTKERVIAQFLARDREQKPMHSTALARDENRLYHAARRHLGSWSEAMRAAGLDPELYRGGPANRSSSINTKSHPLGPAQSQPAEIMRPNHPA